MHFAPLSPANRPYAAFRRGIREGFARRSALRLVLALAVLALVPIALPPQPAAAEIEGFTGPFAPGNWAHITENGTVDHFDSESLTVSLSVLGEPSQDAHVGVAITAPTSGTFRYDWESEMSGGTFIIAANLNIFDASGSRSGSRSIFRPTGNTFRLDAFTYSGSQDDTDFTITFTNFSFEPALHIASEPTIGSAGEPLDFAVHVLGDDLDADSSDDSTQITATLFTDGSPEENASLLGDTTVTVQDGVATFDDLSIDKVGTDYRIEFSADGQTSSTSSEFDMGPGEPHSLAIETQPSSARAGEPLGVVLHVFDAYGNFIDDDDETEVTANIAVDGSGDGAETLNATATATGGIVTFASLAVDKTGSGYRLNFSGPGLQTSSDSDPFAITPNDPHGVTLHGPASAIAGDTPSFTLTLRDTFGNASPATETVDFSLGTDSGSGAFTFNPAAPSISGGNNSTTFTYYEELAETHTITATWTDGGVNVGFATAGINISQAPVGVHMSIQPAQNTAGEPLTGVPSGLPSVWLRDEFENPYPGAPVNVSLLQNGGAANFLDGTATGTTGLDGIAVFDDLRIATAASDYTLFFSTPDNGGTETAESQAFTVLAAAPHSLTLEGPPTATAGVDSSFTFTLFDFFGNVAIATETMDFTLTTDSGSGAFAFNPATATVDTSESTAAFTYNEELAGSHEVTAAWHSGGPNVGSDSGGIDIHAALPDSLGVHVPPATATAGVSIPGDPSGSPAALVRDAFLNPVPGVAVSVDLLLDGLPANFLSGATTRTTGLDGIAILDDLIIATAASDYTLSFSAPSNGGTVADESAAFTVVPAPAHSLVLEGPPTATAGVDSPFTITIFDIFGNVAIATETMDFALTTDSGSGAFTFNPATATVDTSESTAAFTYNEELAGSHQVTAAWHSGGPNVGADSWGINIHPDLPFHLDMETQPGNSYLATPLSGPPAVIVRDTYLNPIEGVGVSVEVLTDVGGPYENASGVLAATTGLDGIAAFGDILLHDQGTFQLRFTTDTLGPTLSQQIRLAVLLADNADLLACDDATATVDSDVPFCTIQAVIDFAMDGEDVFVNPGTYDESLSIGKDLLLTGVGGVASTTIDADGTGERAITIGGGFVVSIDGFTVTGGNGGILNDGNLTLTNSTVTGNTAAGTNGGGIANAGTLDMTGATVSANTSSIDGGGISNAGTFTIDGGAISGNTGGDGGGILNMGTLEIAGAAISDNTALLDGGGILSSGATLAITGATFANNGSGVFLANGNASISGSSFTGHTGHALEQTGGTVTAEENWWDSMRGPTHFDNDGGAAHGQSISGTVDFSPWCADEDCTLFHAIPTELTFQTQPVDTELGALLPGFQVRAQDGGGHLGINFLDAVSLTLNGAGSVTAGTATRDAVDGIASFPGLLIEPHGTYSLTADTAALTATTSVDFDITLTPALLNITTAPTNARAGETLGNVTVEVLNPHGYVMFIEERSITVSLHGNPSAGTLQGMALSKQTTDGQAVFDELFIDLVGDGYTLRFTAGSLTAAVSSGFNIAHNDAAELRFTTQPHGSIAEEPFLRQPLVEVRDRFGNMVTDYPTPVTMEIGQAPGAGILSGTRTQTSADGYAAFTGLTISQPGAGWKLRATADGGVPDVDSEPFTMVEDENAAVEEPPLEPAPVTPMFNVPLPPQVSLQQMPGGPNLTNIFSDALGPNVRILGGNGSLARNSTGNLAMDIPALGLSGDMSVSGPIAFDTGSIQMDTVDGQGTATVTLPNGMTVTGQVTLTPMAGRIEVEFENPVLNWTAPDPDMELLTGGNEDVTNIGAAFDVGLSDLPSGASLDVEYAKEPNELVPDSGAVFSLAAEQAGGAFSGENRDVAFSVTVTRTGIENSDLGDNTVTLSASVAWYEARLAEGKDIVLTKLDSEGNVYSATADCVVTGDTVACTATFTGEAGGFSTFAMLAMSEAAQPEPTPTPTPGDPAPTPVSPEPTATPISEGVDGGGLPIVVLAVLVAIAVAGGAFVVMRKRAEQ